MTLDTLNKLYKFSWGQAFSDTNGKTSGTAIAALFLVLVGGIGFLYGLFLKQSDGMMYGLAFATLGTGLLGYRKSVDGKATDMGITDAGTPAPIKSTSTTTATLTQETSVTPDQQ